MPSWVQYSLSAVISFSAIYASIYYFEYPGRHRLRVRRFAARVRDQLQPVASTLEIELSVLNDEHGTVLHYLFNDGNFISLSFGDDGFNIYSPAWKPGFEKNRAGFDKLLAAVVDTKTHLSR